MANMPRVSVLMPVFNTARFLPATLASLQKQSCREFEALVIDDGSSDDTPAIMAQVRDPRIVYIRHEGNAGLAARLNEGLDRARAPYVARLDGDDIMHPDRLARQLAVLDADPALALLGTNKVNIDEHGQYSTANFCPTDHAQITWYLCFDNPFCHPSVMFRRDIVWGELGGYDASLRYCEDYEMWSRLVRAGHRSANLDDVLMAYRRHTAGMTSRMPELRFSINATVIRDNFRYTFPHEPAGELDAFALAVAEVTYRRRPCDRAFVSRYRHYAGEFMRARQLSQRSMRRVLASHLLTWGSLAKGVDRGLSFECAGRVATLEPRQLTSLLLPGPARELAARRLGRFWEVAAQTFLLSMGLAA